MKKIGFVASLLLFISGNLYSQGSGTAFDLGANAASSNHIDLGNLPLGTSNFTVEFWYNAVSVSSDPAIFSNKSWSSGSNTGVNIAIQSGGSNLDINFKGSVGPRVDMNATGFDFTQGWNHIAVTFDRSGDMTCYVNGINKISSSIAGSTGNITSVNTYKFGQDGTGSYGTQPVGNVDELRIWTSARTESEIRQDMCKKLLGTEPGLAAYYQFEEGTGSIVSDATGNFDATVINGVQTNWITSGAYVGEESDVDYTSTWSGVSQTLTGTTGAVTIENITGTLAGIHLFRVDAVPNTQSGIPSLLSNDAYFGVFLVDASGASYDISYDYSSFTDAVNNETELVLFGRTSNTSTSWSDLLATVNTTTDEATQTSTSTQEIILGFSVGTCSDPTALTTGTIGIQNADLSWTAGNAVAWDVEYGPTGFTPGAGTIVNANTPSITLTNLNPTTTYDVYVTADCGSFGTSTQVGPISFTTQSIAPAAAQGSKMALDFDGVNDWVDLSNGKVSATSLGLPTQDITVECWAYVRDFTTWDAMVGFLQDNGSYERGWDIEVRDGNKFAFALATGGSLNYLETTSEFPLNKWYHVAATYDGTTQKIYINGNLEAISTANSGPIAYADSWLSIGSYKDDNENNHFNGIIDEVRIWNIARSEAEIRDFMCEKLDGTEADLQMYFRLDELAGMSVNDETTGIAPGTMTNMEELDHRISGAPIGDDSEHIHDPADWTTTSLTMTSPTNGDAEARVISGAPHGIHIYRVDGTPQANLPLVPGTDSYYGVFVSEANYSILSNFDFNWDYANFSGATTNETDLIILNRPAKTTTNWAISEMELNTASDFILADTAAYRKEYALGLGNTITCQLPSNLELTGQTTITADGGWQNGGSGISNVQWGEAGFNLGAGTTVSNITTEQAIFGGLVNNITYEFYVQDSCSTANSPWVGPFVFTAERCMEPTNIIVDNETASSATISWDAAVGQDWTISWGAPGFTVDWGIMTTAAGSPFLLNGLAEETTYEFYVRTNCASGNSAWVGPFQFTTISSVGINESTIEISLSPNPSNGKFNISASEELQSVSVMDAKGTIIASEVKINGSQAMINVQDASEGIYFVKVTTNQGTTTNRILINK